MQASQGRTNFTVSWVRLLLISGIFQRPTEGISTHGVHQTRASAFGNTLRTAVVGPEQYTARYPSRRARLSRAKGHGSRRDRQTHSLMRLA